MNYPTRIALACVTAFITATAGSPARADDTEIFRVTPSSALRPNVLFVIDTSISMNADVSIRPPYNPANTYTGSTAICDESRIYWKAQTITSTVVTPPSCGTASSPNNAWVSRTNFKCQSALDTLDTRGLKLVGPAAQWDNGLQKRWETLESSRDAYVECKADAIGGDGFSIDDNLIPKNNTPVSPYTQPWAASGGISWSSSPTNSYYVFYTGKYLNYLQAVAPTDTKERIEIIQDAVNDLLDSSDLDGTNVALMRFNSSNGGSVIYPFTQIETARLSTSAGMHDEVNSLGPYDYTPLSETLWEAYRYLTGRSVSYGSSGVLSVAGSRDPANITSTNYKKIIDTSCENTTLIYLTDGGPTSDMGAESSIETQIGSGYQCTDVVGQVANEGGAPTAVGDGKCLDDLAEYMYNTDLYNDPVLAAANEQKENVKTYTIGFGSSVPPSAQTLLIETAQKGGGQNYVATDNIDLAEAFRNVISEVTAVDVSFTSPTVSVNAFNRTRTLNDLYFSVFEPSRTLHWPGNLKKYQVNADGVLMDNSSTPQAAVDPNTGFFKATSTSFWASVMDGYDVVKGGAANRLPTYDTAATSARKVYTDLSALAGVATNLTHSTNALVDGNTGYVTNASLGLPATATATQRTTLINWARGQDVDDDNNDGSTTDRRFVMGDPLHARPASVIYGKDGSGNVIGVIYMATNDGYLHAIDSQTGVELWSYVPQELLLKMNDLRTNPITTTKNFGLDGSLSVYVIDNNNDGTIDTAAPANDKVYLYFGMGRGGRNYYALDISDRNTPRFMWRSTYSGLGQTWSTPVITKIRIKPDATTPAATKLVAIFGGGYDPDQDGVATDAAAVQAAYRTDDEGNGIYIVDALTGTLQWRAGYTGSGANLIHAKMNNSIPADVRVIDMSGDGLADRMYAADMGGRVWRFDIINGELPATLVRGGVFASLGAGDLTTPTVADARRFYNSPDASILRVGSTAYVNIAIGSGFRGHPLNTNISDRLYSLRDPIPFRAMTAAEYTTMDAGPIRDTATSTDLEDVTTAANPTISASKKGWKINLATGEKVLTEAVTFSGTVIVSTYTPETTSSSFSCAPRAGTNTTYTVKAANGAAAFDRDGDLTLETSDRKQVLNQQGIAPTAVILFPTPNTPSSSSSSSSSSSTSSSTSSSSSSSSSSTPPPLCGNSSSPPVAYVGTETVTLTLDSCPKKTFWSQSNAD